MPKFTDQIAGKNDISADQLNQAAMMCFENAGQMSNQDLANAIDDKLGMEQAQRGV